MKGGLRRLKQRRGVSIMSSLRISNVRLIYCFLKKTIGTPYFFFNSFPKRCFMLIFSIEVLLPKAQLVYFFGLINMLKFQLQYLVK